MMLLNFNGESTATEKGVKFAEEFLDHIRERLVEFQQETGTMFNLEATPGEGTCHRFAKEDKKIPIINTCYLVDEYTGITLYYEHYYGSLLDKTECVITNQKVKGLGFKKLFFMLDRGYFSSKNIEDLANDEF